MGRPGATEDVFRAIADGTRRRLLDGLRGGEQPVGTLSAAFDVSPSAVSQHLSVLKAAGLVRERRAGRQRLYRIRAAPLRDVAAWIACYERLWDQKLDALGSHLDEEARPVTARPGRRRR
jgi:DNA-binding transcriptional ArsR family regulator